MRQRMSSSPSTQAVIRVSAIICLVVIGAAMNPGRAAADETEVIEQILRILRCVINPGIPMLGVFCTWH